LKPGAPHRRSKAVVEFYYAIGSRYSYLAATQIPALKRDTGCEVRWQPINSRALMERRGADPFKGPPVSGQYDWRYRELDAQRWAALYGVPFVEPRGRVDFDPELLARAAVAAKLLGHGEAYSLDLFSAMFVERSVTRLDRDECIRRAARYTLRQNAFTEELETSSTLDALHATLVQALDHGVFGVPTFVCSGQLFWGNDRISLLRHFLLSKPA
jgi:2-hydroxychromene-2-carboxylate isomerase